MPYSPFSSIKLSFPRCQGERRKRYLHLLLLLRTYIHEYKGEKSSVLKSDCVRRLLLSGYDSLFSILSFYPPPTNAYNTCATPSGVDSNAITGRKEAGKSF